MRWPWRPCALPDLRLGRLVSCFGSPLENGEACRLPARWHSSKAASSSFIRSSFRRQRPVLLTQFLLELSEHWFGCEAPTAVLGGQGNREGTYGLGCSRAGRSGKGSQMGVEGFLVP